MQTLKVLTKAGHSLDENPPAILEEACLARFGTLRPAGPTPVVRSGNGLIFQSRRFRAACRDLSSAPGIHHTLHRRTERPHRTLFPQPQRRVSSGQHNFVSFAEARIAITQWIEWYNAERPHQALGYRSPRQFRALQLQLVA
jgi:putative transposase